MKTLASGIAIAVLATVPLRAQDKPKVEAEPEKSSYSYMTQDKSRAVLNFSVPEDGTAYSLSAWNSRSRYKITVDMNEKTLRIGMVNTEGVMLDTGAMPNGDNVKVKDKMELSINCVDNLIVSVVAHNVTQENHFSIIVPDGNCTFKGFGSVAQESVPIEAKPKDDPEPQKGSINVSRASYRLRK